MSKPTMFSMKQPKEPTKYVVSRTETLDGTLSYFRPEDAEYMQDKYFTDYNIYIKVGSIVELYRSSTKLVADWKVK